MVAAFWDRRDAVTVSRSVFIRVLLMLLLLLSPINQPPSNNDNDNPRARVAVATIVGGGLHPG